MARYGCTSAVCWVSGPGHRAFRQLDEIGIARPADGDADWHWLGTSAQPAFRRSHFGAPGIASSFPTLHRLTGISRQHMFTRDRSTRHAGSSPGYVRSLRWSYLLHCRFEIRTTVNCCYRAFELQRKKIRVPSISSTYRAHPIDQIARGCTGQRGFNHAQSTCGRHWRVLVTVHSVVPARIDGVATISFFWLDRGDIERSVVHFLSARAPREPR